MSGKFLATRPTNSLEKKLIEKYAESFADQSELMDKLAQQLLTLELVIPGLYATALKLVAGDDATMSINALLIVSLGLWFAALVLTLLALSPREWKVNTTIMQQDPDSTSDELGIKEFFSRTARYKRNRLVPAAMILFAGIACAVLSVM